MNPRIQGSSAFTASPSITQTESKTKIITTSICTKKTTTTTKNLIVNTSIQGGVLSFTASPSTELTQNNNIYNKNYKNKNIYNIDNYNSNNNKKKQ